MTKYDAVSRISRATAALAAALAERCVSRISTASVTLAAALRQQNFFGLRLFLEGFFLQSRDGLGLRLAVGVGLGVVIEVTWCGKGARLSEMSCSGWLE